MTIFRDSNKERPDKMSDWMKDFANYWEKAEDRIKKADYVSNVQRALNGQGSVEDMVSDMRNRVGLDLIDEIKKESEIDEIPKTASEQELPEALRQKNEFLEEVSNYISAHPFVSYEALDGQFDNELLADPEIEKYVRGIIANAREGQEQQSGKINYVVDHIDASDNKYLDYNEDRTNKI